MSGTTLGRCRYLTRFLFISTFFHRALRASLVYLLLLLFLLYLLLPYIGVRGVPIKRTGSAKEAYAECQRIVRGVPAGVYAECRAN